MEIIDKINVLLLSEQFYGLYELLKVNIKRFNPNNDIVLRCINVLIENDYIEEADELVNSLCWNHNKKIIMKVFKSKIKDKQTIKNYDNGIYKVYRDACQLGHEYYQNGQLADAYYVYEWGYYVTENPVFLYYMGKIFYKTGSYKLASEYLNKYLKSGGEKTSKAYMYLGWIARFFNHKDESSNYFTISNMIKKIDKSKWYIERKGNSESEEVDYVKMRNQFAEKDIGLDYFEDKLNCPEFYEIRDLYMKGYYEKANILLSNLESKQPKSYYEKFAIRLLRKNHSLYKAKNRS